MTNLNGSSGDSWTKEKRLTAACQINDPTHILVPSPATPEDLPGLIIARTAGKK
jgi:hypothetical protein